MSIQRHFFNDWKTNGQKITSASIFWKTYPTKSYLLFSPWNEECFGCFEKISQKYIDHLQNVKGYPLAFLEMKMEMEPVYINDTEIDKKIRDVVVYEYWQTIALEFEDEERYPCLGYRMLQDVVMNMREAIQRLASANRKFKALDILSKMDNLYWKYDAKNWKYLIETLGILEKSLVLLHGESNPDLRNSVKYGSFDEFARFSFARLTNIFYYLQKHSVAQLRQPLQPLGVVCEDWVQEVSNC